ncbi:hypothetical protein KRR38_24190 [Novosphingobium sp. G106]|uniref:hypothetical protein n=1 Tax=Novosphingobium sp. G106 TaxID=2849500 RepID=UPI001C2D3CDE|nr:hypothetical protein [Novosphingobium sp. G106]MBV1690694.1 hypothetical protein [Novosphingobium sp. G106]
MFVSKLGRILLTSTFVLVAAPTLAAEASPLDDTALGQVTAQGIGDLAMLAWLPERGDRFALLPAAGIGADSAPADDLFSGVLRSNQSAVSLPRPNEGSAASRILQTATIDLPASQGAVGVIMQSTSYQFGGQSATNLAVAATLNGAGNFGSIRP